MRRIISSKVRKTGVLLLLVNITTAGATHAMGEDLMKFNRDSGVIGEKKTIREYKPGMTVAKRGATFATPQVLGDVAYFGLGPYETGATSLGYSFHFTCLGWKYHNQAYWSSADVTAERVGFWVQLESPDKTTVIQTQEVDIPVTASLTTPLTPAQLEVLERQTYVEDPFIGEERLAAAQQAITWLVEKHWKKYRILTHPTLQFTVDRIGENILVKTELEVLAQETQAKKCILWALNRRGSRLKGSEQIRRMQTWICSVIGDAPDYASLAAKARMVLETLTFPTPISEETRRQQVAEFERQR